MRVTLMGFYVTMAIWMLIGSAGRVALQLSAHQPLDVLPIISTSLAVIALAFLFINNGRRRTGDDQ